MSEIPPLYSDEVINRSGVIDKSFIGKVIMAMKVGDTLLHWNYFIALESDLDQVSRYIEFHRKNYSTYSIELAHLLLASASEVDVISKSICLLVDPNSSAENINDYREIITQHISPFSKERVFIPRFGITLRPWFKWNKKGGDNPLWWRSYNNVKHQRDDHFNDANLKNVLDAIGGLLIVEFYFYKLKFSQSDPKIKLQDVTRRLIPESRLLRLDEKYYSTVMLWE